MNLPSRPFLFLRHGQTPYNREGRFQGHADVPLSDTGHEQAQAAAHILSSRSIERIIASPARRVQQTIQPLADMTQLPVTTDERLMEVYVGSLEGRLIADVRQEHGLQPEDSWFSILPEDAERWESFVPRVCAAVTHWTEHYANELLLIAAHGLVFKALVEALTGEIVFSGNAEPHLFDPVGERWNISRLD